MKIFAIKASDQSMSISVSNWLERIMRVRVWWQIRFLLYTNKLLVILVYFLFSIS